MEETPWNGEKSTQKQEKKFESDCSARIFSLDREDNLQRLRSKLESTEEEEMKQQRRMAIMKDLIKKI